MNSLPKTVTQQRQSTEGICLPSNSNSAFSGGVRSAVRMTRHHTWMSLRIADEESSARVVCGREQSVDVLLAELAVKPVVLRLRSAVGRHVRARDVTDPARLQTPSHPPVTVPAQSISSSSSSSSPSSSSSRSEIGTSSLKGCESNYRPGGK